MCLRVIYVRYLDLQAKEAENAGGGGGGGNLRSDGIEEVAVVSAKDEKEKPVGLIEKEKLERGSVAFSTYWKYITASGKFTMLVGVIGGQIMYNLSQVGVVG